MSSEVTLLIIAGVFGFVVLWVFVTFLISAVGGWRTLARHYRSELPFSGRTWSYRSGVMGGFARYNGVLTVGVNPAGLYLAVMPLFRAGHAPLFIPWGEVGVASERRFLVSFIVFTFSRAPGVSLRLYERFGREVLETARVPTTMHGP